MTLNDVFTQTRIHLKDTTQNVWTNTDITVFCNDAIRIIRKTVPLYFTTLLPVTSATDIIAIPMDYEYLIPLFCASRCFEQDEQHYRAVQKMNEFESRREDMKDEILDSDAYAAILITQENGGMDYVQDVYYSVDDDDEIDP